MSERCLRYVIPRHPERQESGLVADVCAVSVCTFALLYIDTRSARADPVSSHDRTLLGSIHRRPLLHCTYRTSL